MVWVVISACPLRPVIALQLSSGPISTGKRRGQIRRAEKGGQSGNFTRGIGGLAWVDRFEQALKDGDFD